MKHIFKGSLFIYNTEFQSTSGLFVEQAYNCYVISKNFIQKKKNPVAQTSENIIGQMFQVRQGSYKGY